LTLEAEKVRVYGEFLRLVSERQVLFQELEDSQREVESLGVAGAEGNFDPSQHETVQKLRDRLTAATANVGDHNTKMARLLPELALVAPDDLIESVDQLMKNEFGADHDKAVKRSWQLCRADLPNGAGGTRAHRPGSQYVGWLKQFAEVAGAVAVLAVPLFVVRALFAAGFDEATALVIVANSSIADVGTATLLLVSPVLTQASAALLSAHIGSRSPKFTPALLLKMTMLFALTAFLWLTAGSWYQAVLFPLGVYAIIGLGWWRLRGKEARIEINHINAIVFLSLMVVLTIIASPMWRPAEEIVVDGSPRTVYVLSEQGDELVLLFRKDRDVERVQVDRIESRRYCNAGRARHFAFHELPRCVDQ
jgi:hypothetical protein